MSELKNIKENIRYTIEEILSGELPHLIQSFEHSTDRLRKCQLRLVDLKKTLDKLEKVPE